MTTPIRVFISSKMLELSQERNRLYEFLPSLTFHGFSVQAWVFENDVSASDDSIRKIYLDALRNSDLYVGLFFNEYGKWTIDEFERATKWHIPRLIYIKKPASQTNELRAFLTEISNVETGLTPNYFATVEELCEKVQLSIRDWIEEYRIGPLGDGKARIYRQVSDIMDRPKRLIGRDNLLEKALEFLSQREPVLLQGFSGSGKTALAAEIATTWIKDRSENVLWMRLGRNSFESILEGLLATVAPDEITAASGASKEEQIHILQRSFLQLDFGLLVLDDAWNDKALYEVVHVVPQNMALIITSRNRYPLMNFIEVGRLDRSDSIQALNYYAGRELSDPSYPDQLCSLLDDNIFALRIAGMKLKVDGISSQLLYEQIKNAPQDMKAPMNWTNEGQENISSLLQISLNALDKGAHNIFFAFGILFAPHATVELIVLLHIAKNVLERGVSNFDFQVTVSYPADTPINEIPTELSSQQVARSLIVALFNNAADISKIRDALGELHRRGLIDYFRGTDEYAEHYQVHNLAYRFAHARIPDVIHDVALEACLGYVGVFKSTLPAHFLALRAELDNLLGAVRWALSRDYYYEVDTIVGALCARGGSEFLILQGRLTEAIEFLQLAIEAMEKAGNSKFKATHLNNLGATYNRIGQEDKALNVFVDLLSVYQSTNDQDGEAMCLNNLGIAYRSTGDLPTATDLLQQAITLNKTMNDKYGEALALGNLGLVLQDFRRYHDAIELHNKSLEIGKEIYDLNIQSVALSNLGNAYHGLNEREKALELFDQALVIAKQQGDVLAQASDLHNIGVIHKYFARFELAIRYLQEAHDIYALAGKKDDAEKDLRLIDEVRQTITPIEANLTTINKLIEDFETSFKGWTIHIPTGNELRRGNYLFGLIYVVLKDPRGKDFIAHGTAPTENIEQTIYTKIQDVIRSFTDDLEKRSDFPLFIRLEITPISGEQSQVKIHQLDFFSSERCYHVTATLYGKRFLVHPTIHLYMNVALSQSGMKKLEPFLTKFIEGIIDDTPILKYMLNRNEPIQYLKLHFGDIELLEQENIE